VPTKTSDRSRPTGASGRIPAEPASAIHANGVPDSHDEAVLHCRSAEIALEAARKAQDVRGRAAILYSTGLLHSVQGRGGQAMRDLEAAARLFEDAADEDGAALVTRHMAFLDRLSGRLDDAARRYEQVLAIFRTTGQHMAAACALLNMALIKLELHEFAC
jgi:tetratricopeptide (TPR) repeat protein